MDDFEFVVFMIKVYLDIVINDVLNKFIKYLLEGYLYLVIYIFKGMDVFVE